MVLIFVLVMKLADISDLKSDATKMACEFESHRGYS